MSYMGGAEASSFSDIPYSAPSASKPPLKMKKLPGEKAQICFAGCPPVTHRDGLCAGFKTQFGKMYHEANILAR